jgi:hypothetical protein
LKREGDRMACRVRAATSEVRVTEQALRDVGQALSLAARGGSADVPEYIDAIRTMADRMFWIVEAQMDGRSGIGLAWGLIEEGLRPLWTAPNGETDARTAAESL